MNPETILWSQVLLQAIWDLSESKLKLPKKEVPTLQRLTRAWFSFSMTHPAVSYGFAMFFPSILTPFDNAYLPNQPQN